MLKKQSITNYMRQSRQPKLSTDTHFKFTSFTSSKGLLDFMLLPLEFANLKFV